MQASTKTGPCAVHIWPAYVRPSDVAMLVARLPVTRMVACALLEAAYGRLELALATWVATHPGKTPQRPIRALPAPLEASD